MQATHPGGPTAEAAINHGLAARAGPHPRGPPNSHHIIARPNQRGLPTPLPPFSQPDPKISGFLTTSFNMLSLWKTLNEETFRMSLEPLQCPICLDPLRGLPSWKEVLSTPCGHLFCNTCLVTALR